MARGTEKNGLPKDFRSDFIHLFLPNILLVLFTVAVIFFAHHLYDKRIHALTLKENRFITTEWYLLQTLVNQTERELREKDREIEALRLRYSRLLRNNGSADLLERLEAEIEAALADRADILERRLQTSGDIPAVPAAAIDTYTVAENASVGSRGHDALLITLRERMNELAAQLEAEQKQIEILKREISTVPAASTIPRQTPAADYEERLETLRAGIDEVRSLIAERLMELEDGSDGAVEGLMAYQLVRALLSDPAIQVQYPALIADLDAYIEGMGLQEQHNGLRLGYATALDLINELIPK